MTDSPRKMLSALASFGQSTIKSAIGRVAAEVNLDAMVNEVTGFGTTRDKTTYGRFASFSALDDTELSSLYHGDPMAARLVDTAPEESMRKGFESDTGVSELNDWLAERHRELDTQGKFLEADRWGSLYGGAVLLIGANDGNPGWAPLDVTRIKSVKYLYLVDRRYISPLTYYDEMGHPKLGEPQTYLVSGGASQARAATHVVHESRLIRFGGAPTGENERAQLGGWDYSVLQKPHEVLLQFNTGWKAVEHMLTDANQAVFKVSGLAEMLGGTEAAEAALKARIKAVDMFRSVMRAIVVDAGDSEVGTSPEDFSRQSVSFADIPATLDKLMLRLAGTAPMPVTFLMGQSPAGLSSTGESDFRWFYDRIETRRENKLAPKLRRLNEILLASADAPKIKAERNNIKFDALWTLDPLQEAQRRQALATADAAYVAAQVYLPEEIALSRSTVEGFGEDITLTDEARDIRTERVTGDVADLLDELEDDGTTETTEAPVS